MPTRIMLIALVAAFCFSCAGPASNLSVVSKTLKRDVNASTAGGFGIGEVPSSGLIFWVEGKVKNSGTEEIKNVTVGFRVTDGNSKLVLSAVIPSIPAGATVDFRTRPQGSLTELRFAEGEPDITVER
jgi:hypothetical protein